MNVKEELQAIFRDVFDDESIIISESTTANDIAEWDSFAQMTLVLSIEKCFNLKFSVQEIKLLKNVGEMIALIEEKL